MDTYWHATPPHSGNFSHPVAVHVRPAADAEMELREVIAEGHPSLCASWTALPGERVALAGPSGCGKSLQIDAIAGDAAVVSGCITFAPGVRRLLVCRKGWLGKLSIAKVGESGEARRETVRARLLEQFTGGSGLRPRLRGVHFRGEPCEPNAQRQCSVVDLPEQDGSPEGHEVRREEPFSDLQESLTESPQRDPERCLDAILWRLGITSLAEHSLDELSLSDAVRVGIAALALWHPNVLLLDDVTDDMAEEACACLEASLTQEPPLFETVLVASRDRTFMDKVCNKVIAIHAGATKVLDGTYTKAYLAGGDFLHFRRFSLWQPKSSGLRATQAACAFASLVSRSLCTETDFTDLTLVDVGTGTGVLALIFAQEWERVKGSLAHLHIHALDIDENAVRVATANFSSSPWAGKMRPIHSPLEHWQVDQLGQMGVQSHSLVFVCNPPYDDKLVNMRKGTDDEKLSRRRALDRSFLPLDELCTVALKAGCRSLWILWGNAEEP